MPITKYHSAHLELNALQDECQALEEHDKTKLVHLQAAEVQNPVNDQTKFNQAQYVGVAHVGEIPELTFIAVDDATKVPSIIADQLALGALLIFDETLFVKNEEQRVLGFGKT